MYLHEDKGLFFDVVNAASEKLNIPMAVIEKDYYVTMILKLLSSKSENCVFKGELRFQNAFTYWIGLVRTLILPLRNILGKDDEKH